MRRIAELEGLRGLLAWWVVAGHILYTFSDTLGRLSHNRAAVDVFIALSGFVIMFLLDSRREAVGPFLIRRFMRLYPAYLVILLASALALGLTVEAIGGSPMAGARNGERMAFALSALNNLPAHLAAHLTMLHGLVSETVLPHADLAIVGPMWSISVEWQFYLLAPAIYAGLTSGWWGRGGVLALAAGLMLCQLIPGLDRNSAFIGASVPWFALGIGTFFLWKAEARRSMLALAALSFVAGLILREVGALVWVGVLWLLAEAPGTGLARKVLNATPIRTLGEMSYSTYLGHMLPLYLAMWAFNGLGAGRAYIAAVTASTILGTLALSYALYRWVEKPGMALGSRLAAGRVAQPA